MSKKMLPKEIEEVLKVGTPLFDVGVHNWALTKSQVMLAIERLRSLEIPILGGDVYEIINGVLQSNYDNWYCDALPDETQKNFVRRSINKAISFIETYKPQDPIEVFFVLVPEA
ncbi:MAG: Imm40 family immunity protein [Flavisolibacter sp.]